MSQNSPFPKANLRSALTSALPDNDQVSNELREPRFTYVPASHARALNPENTIVEGMRGAGKSHWWAALHNEAHRKYLADVFPESKIDSGYEISQGWGLGLPPDKSPSKDVLAGLLGKAYNPRHIWQSVVAVHAKIGAPFPQQGNWEEKTKWIRDNPEQHELLIYNAGVPLFNQNRKQLVLFDALDRLADDWRGLRPLARALFQLSLDMLANKGIRLKLFVRPDMLEDKEILAFPDSSKLSARTVHLTWQRADLYALLFQCLANEPQNGSSFRDHCKAAFGQTWDHKSAQNAWVLSEGLRHDESLQKDVFHALAGPTMAAAGPSGHKRGFPYTWLPNHLVDSRDQVSPRSFFAALRSATSKASPESWPYALDFKAIQAGVQEASTIRVKEITQEDYPWVGHLMEPLKNKITVPCQEGDIIDLWRQLGTIASIQTASVESGVKLLPPHIEEGPSGVLRDMKDLGVLSYISDGRIQVPDIYRVAFGLGRKGGVKPLK